MEFIPKCNSYSKAGLYKIYCELYQKLEEKASLIAEHVVTVSEFLKKSAQVTTTSAILTPMINTSAKNDVFIRKFETLKIEEKTENFLMVVLSSNTWQEIGLFLRTAVYLLTQARRKKKNCNYYRVTIKKDENTHFTGWDQCYSKTKKRSFRNIILRLQRSCLCNKRKVQLRNIGIDGSASIKKIAKKRTDKQQTLRIQGKTARVYYTRKH